MEENKFYIVTNWADNPKKQMKVFLTKWDSTGAAGHVSDYTGVSSCVWSHAMVSGWTWTPDNSRGVDIPAASPSDGDMIDHIVWLIDTKGEELTDSDVVAAIRDYLIGGQ